MHLLKLDLNVDHAVALMLLDDAQGAAMRHQVARFSGDFNAAIPGSLYFLVAGHEFFGSAHLIRARVASLREAVDALPGDHSAPGPLAVVGLTAIRNDRLYSLLLTRIRNAHCGASVAQLGKDPAAL
eukprot:jgi/Tetstr1/437200/TSEL_002770.t1